MAKRETKENAGVFEPASPLILRSSAWDHGSPSGTICDLLENVNALVKIVTLMVLQSISQ